MQSSSIQDLNLARKWRPQTFDTVVGQDIPIKMLKNSLFLKKFFPVYLFAGQRGCGKTTTARILAAAANCLALESFQQNPTANTIPCLSCQSCVLMRKGNHPDFIEIDAASNTGVDNIRQLIETASYVPLAGNKKIFLIDEAHMLSKAAFNAFLKILEEPPRSVLFILATTELQKIPQTVLSRCFHVVFSSINKIDLRDHLATICTQENIAIEPGALDAIIQETDGSARDAINLLEQVRFAHDVITSESILQTLGKLSNEIVIRLVECIIEKNPRQLLTVLASIDFDRINPESLWEALSDFCKALLWLKYESPTIATHLQPLQAALTELAEQCSLNRLHAMMQLLWHQEPLFLRTNRKHAFLETLLIQLCSQTNIVDLEELLQQVRDDSNNSSGTANKTPQITQKKTVVQKPVSSVQRQAPEIPEPKALVAQEQEAKEPAEADDSVPTPAPLKPSAHSPYHEQWQQFKTDLVAANGDPIATSILLQALLIGLSDSKSALVLQLNKNNKFFKDSVESARPWWQPLLLQHFAGITAVDFVAGEELQTTQRSNTPPNSSATRPETAKVTASEAQPAPTSNNPEDWPIAHLVKKHVPGRIKKSHLPN